MVTNNEDFDVDDSIEEEDLDDRISDEDLFQESEVSAAPPVAQQSEPYSKLESAAMGAAQGLTWGHSDEIGAAIESTFTKRSYAASLAHNRRDLKAAEKANPNYFMGGDIAGTVIRDAGIMFIPGANILRTAQIGKSVAIGAADAALESWGRADDKTSLATAKNVATDAAFGAGIFGAVAATSKGIQAAVKAVKARNPQQTEALMQSINYDAIIEGKLPSPESIARQAEMLKDVGMNTWKDATRIAKRNTKQAKRMVDEGPKQWPNDLINWKLNRPAATQVTVEDFDRVKEVWDGLGDAGKKGSIQNFYFGKALQTAHKHMLKTPHGRKMVAGLKDPLEAEWFAKVRAPSQNADLVDNTMKTNMRGIVSAASKADDMTMQGAVPFLQRQAVLAKKAKKAGLSNDDIRLGLIGQGEKPLTFPQNAILGEYRSWFNDARKSLIKDGLEIRKLPNYFSRMQMNIIDSRVAITREWQKVKAGKATREEREGFVATVKYMFPDLRENPGESELLKAFKSITDSDTANLRGSIPEAFSVFSRKDGDIPHLLQETDVHKVMSNYVLMNYKALHMRSPLEQLQSHISLFRGMNLDSTAKIWEDYYRQLTSSPGNYQAALNGTSAKIKIAGQKMMEEGGLTGKVGALLNEVPEFASWMSTQIYPNYLGMNLHSPIRNMAQTWFVTAPELKGAYGYNVVRKAWVRAAKMKAKGENWGDFLDKKGLRAPDFNNDGLVNNLQENLGKLGVVGKGIDTVGKWGLKLYGMSDSANRYLTYHAAQQVTEDLLKKTKGSQNFLSKMRTGPKQVIEDALARGDKETLSKEVTTYLIDKTQFKYTRSDLSQFAREFGRVYNMFSKWPTMIIGDLEYSARTRKGMDKLLEPMGKYAAPLMMLTGVQQYIESTGDLDPKLQLFLGKDLSKWSPFSAVLGLQAPPLLQIPQATFKALQSASEGELKRAGGEIGKAMQPFVPGLYFYRTGTKVKEIAESF